MRKSFCLFAAVALFFVCSCDFNEKSSIKNTTLEIDSSHGKKVYFMAASMDSADIPAGSVPQFDFNTARNAVAEKNNFSMPKAAVPRNLQRYAENVSKMNLELVRSLNSSERAAANVAYKTKIFNPENKNTCVELLVDENSFETKTEETERVYSGEHCNVFFVKNGDFNITKSQLSSVLKTLGNLFDEKIFPNITDILGKFSYPIKYSNVIKCPEKVNIVVADLYYDWEKTKEDNGGVFGYYRGVDFLKDYSSNQDAIIYLDSYFLSKSPESIYSTMAHEFNHMLNFMNKGLENNLKYSTWYTEMLSALADAMFENYLVENLAEEQSITSSRIPYFNTWHNLGFSTWRSGADYCPYGDVYISYGNVFAFGNFLAKNYGGFELIKEIATNRFVDEASVVQAVREIAGKSDITFKDILKKFSCVQITNCLDEDSLPTLNKKVAYSKNESIYLPAIKSSLAFFKDDNYTFYPDSAFCSSNKPYTPVVLGQYGFLSYGYCDGAISSIETSYDSDYNAFPYTVIGK